MAFHVNPFDAVVYGGGALIGAGALVGMKSGDQDEPAGDRAAQGGIYAAALGIGAAATYPVWSSKNLWKKAGGGVKNYFTNIPNRYKSALGAETGIAARMRAVPTSVYAGTGAVLGALAAGEDHRTVGAAVGAGAGLALRAGMHSANFLTKGGPVAKVGAAAALALGAAVVGSQFAPQGASEVAGVEMPDGEREYMSPEEAAHYQSGVRRRMNNVGATGNIVFGAHNARH